MAVKPPAGHPLNFKERAQYVSETHFLPLLLICWSFQLTMWALNTLTREGLNVWAALALLAPLWIVFSLIQAWRKL